MPHYANRRHNRRQRRLLYGGGVVGVSLIASAIIVGTTMGAETNPNDTASARALDASPAEIDFWPSPRGNLVDPRLAVEPTTTPSQPPTRSPSPPPESSPPGEEPTPTPSTSPSSPSTPPDSDPSAAPTEGFPDGSNTGVPSGVDLTASDGLTITEDGTVVDALEITGTVKVKADDVVLLSSKIMRTGMNSIHVKYGTKNPRV